LRWSSKLWLDLLLPYPGRGAVFVMDGKPMKAGDGVSPQRLAGVRLILQDGSVDARYSLRIELRSVDSHRMVLKQALPPLQDGRLDYPMVGLTDDIEALLSTAGRLEVVAVIGVFSRTQQLMARMIVRWYDLELMPDRPTRTVTLAPEMRHLMAAEGVEGCSLQMVHLTRPQHPPISLPLIEPENGVWQIPSELEIGPWWVLGREGRWSRFRPLLWSHWGRRGSEESTPLIEAIHEHDSELRERLLTAALKGMGRDQQHYDWYLLYTLIRLGCEYTPTSVDVVRHLMTMPEMLIHMLLTAERHDRQRVWGLADRMPFMWHLFSLESWRMVLFRLQRDLFHLMEGDEDRVWEIMLQKRQLLAIRYPWIGIIVDSQLPRLFGGRSAPVGELQLARVQPDLLRQQLRMIEMAMQGRHSDDEIWPESEQVLELSSLLPLEMRFKQLSRIQRTVRCAPFVAAQYAIQGLALEESELQLMLYQMRVIRSFDEAWFDVAHAIGLALLLVKPGER
jgi:hypothetical protein